MPKKIDKQGYFRSGHTIKPSGLFDIFKCFNGTNIKLSTEKKNQKVL